MGKKRHMLSQEERALFQREMGDTTPIEHDRAEPFKAGRKPYPLPPAQLDELEVVDEYFDGMETGEELLFIRPGVQNRLFQALRRGRIPPQERLDLHGMRVAEARAILGSFLEYTKEQRLRVVHIIHGKGTRSEGRQPVLKQRINQWLRQRQEVLAFCSAPNFDGGTGAVYVLLSRKERFGER